MKKKQDYKVKAKHSRLRDLTLSYISSFYYVLCVNGIENKHGCKAISSFYDFQVMYIQFACINLSNTIIMLWILLIIIY